MTFSFLAIILAMLIANLVAVWQLRRTRSPSQLLSEADQLSLAAMTVHLDVDTLRNRLTALADIDDGRDFVIETESLRRKFLADIAHAHQLFTTPGGAQHDPVILRTLETLKVTLPSQIDKVTGLAASNDWQEVRLRLADQVQGLADLSSLLVERVGIEVSQRRAEAVESAQRVSHEILMVLPATALLTMLLAVFLGLRATKSITEPLSELHAGAEALARGELAMQLKVTGQDELTTVAKAFNLAAQRLRESYGQLRNSESALREQANLLDLTHDAILVMDMEGVIKYWNRGAEEKYGWIAGQAVGRDVHDLLNTVFPAPLEQIKAELTRTGRWEGELVHTRRDGNQVVVASRWSLQSDEHGAPVAILETNNDITERKRVEEERERLQVDLAHVNRVSMLGELAASIAHEVNQPLSGVVSNASAGLRWLATDAPNVEEVREGLRRIVRDGKRAGEVIARIRALTKKAATPREKLDLNETIRDVLALVGDEAKKKSVRTQTQFADDLAPVSGDRVQLQQVVLNLVMNAIEAMSGVADSRRELAVTTRNVDADQVQVAVEDSGIGLDPNATESIFDPFYTTKPGGMGMGLSICRSILQAHGGRLWATANLGPGTTFSFTLPGHREEGSNAGITAV